MDAATAMTADAPAPGCTCCKPPATTPADEVRELQARHEELERRLARLADARR